MPTSKKPAPKGPYCYGLEDDGVVFYVGKGRRGRMFAHEKEAARGVVSDKCDRIRLILAEGREVGYRILGEYDTDREAYEAEKEWVAKFPGLTNQTAGGGGAPTASPEKVAFRAWLDAIAMRQRVMPFGEWVARRNPPDPGVYWKLVGEMDRLVEFLRDQMLAIASGRTQMVVVL